MGLITRNAQIIASSLTLFMGLPALAQDATPAAPNTEQAASNPAPVVTAATPEDLSAFLGNPQSILAVDVAELPTRVASLLLAAVSAEKLTEALTALQAAALTASPGQAAALVSGSNLAAATLAAGNNQVAAAQIQVAVASSAQLAEASRRSATDTQTAETGVVGGGAAIGTAGGDAAIGTAGGDAAGAGGTGGGGTEGGTTTTASGTGTFNGASGGSSGGSTGDGGTTVVSPTTSG